MSDRFYTPMSLDDPTVKLEGAEAHHLLNVLRKTVGETVLLFDGRGTEAVAEIVSLSRNSADLKVLTKRSATVTDVPLILGTAVPKGDRFRWLIEKATELGVSRLVPLLTARSVVDPGVGKLEKMQNTVIAACKQSGRSKLMDIDAPTTWNEFISREFSDRAVFVAHPSGQLADALSADAGFGGSIVLAVGPEGGFTDEELASAVDAGARLVGLGPRILRIETAAIAMTTLFSLSSSVNP